ncbi:phosphatidylglycerol lysyltransferase domain-containing protein [Saccharibacillus endophyticus]|uniref:Phosphatidylglycerol lysyltransferase C-terminal domain-containing protein n=1 Tax=Saccharibacillus endophyticus TaxID=2060666 RepID=A0ABQ1ZZH4_9BACL|nr:phosphatidylglycerol lysyltransferase domain-containing protein [Saccharibacillus endophyticus]GGH80801.1 hypothetical protein GCM10007362_29670 [Saccharibacillus endophyticus]
MSILQSTEKMDLAYSVLKQYSLDSQHYLSFKKESTFFFGERVRGMISYELAGKKVMSIGDPVCKSEDLENFTIEYLNFCERMGWKPVFNSVSIHMIKILKKHKFSVLKYGEEAILNLSEYTLDGASKSSLRRNVSKVDKRGVWLKEYCPQVERDHAS